MDMFGQLWHRHWEKVEKNWKARVEPDDLVLLPGDHSWAMRMDEAREDLDFISALPGRKVLVRGNHDYWWQGVKKIRQAFPGLHFLQNDSLVFEGVGLCGTRGWNLPGADGFSHPHDEKIYRRELERLKLSIRSLPKDVEHRIAMLHYPPLMPRQTRTEVTEILEESGIEVCVYGHLHLTKGVRPFEGELRGVRYHLVSCDHLRFDPLEIRLP